jgi:hypothetical protein
MYYLKTKNFKYLSISWGRDDNSSKYFVAFKLNGRPFFDKDFKVIDICLWGRRLVLTF